MCRETTSRPTFVSSLSRHGALCLQERMPHSVWEAVQAVAISAPSEITALTHHSTPLHCRLHPLPPSPTPIFRLSSYLGVLQHDIQVAALIICPTFTLTIRLMITIR